MSLATWDVMKTSKKYKVFCIFKEVQQVMVGLRGGREGREINK